MKVFFKKSLLDLLKISDKAVKLGKFRLGTASVSGISTDLSNFFENSYDPEQDIGRSPTNGFYTFEYLMRDEKTLQISFNIPDTDLGIRSSLGYDNDNQFIEDGYYTMLYAYYADLEFLDNWNLGFILFNDKYNNNILGKLKLDHNINIINIPFEHNCLLAPGVSSNSQFLEGTGITTYQNIYRESINSDSIYVSKESYDDFLKDIQFNDLYDHNNYYLNKFGIKIY